mgnify:CR=1 FL=1
MNAEWSENKFTHSKLERFSKLISIISIDDTNIKKIEITQENDKTIVFQWTGQEYELVADMSFWKQSSPVETFIDTISQQYAGEVIIGESQKIGFQPIKYQENSDGSNTLVLERWNN